MSDNSKSQITRKWKIKNADKVKSYAKKYNREYYQRTREKRSLEFKIDYHRYAIRNCIPYTYYEDVDDKLQFITADHDYFDDKLRPKLLWGTIIGRGLTLEEIQNNIDYVIRLQRKNIIPTFLFEHAETLILYQELASLKYRHMRGTLSVKIGSEEWNKKCEILDKEWDELYDKLLDENYEKHIVKTKKNVLNGEIPEK